ncbi:MAG: twin-arginine translocation pathway signal protein [Rhizobiaceae bacterium]
MTTRRNVLMILGGGMIAAAGGAGGWAMTREAASARAPWRDAQAMSPQEAADARIFALAHAILAPNPHNRQPWIADLSVADEVTLYCQADRHLPHTDPFDRQIVIGLGCFCELLVMAAAETGHRVDADFFPDGEPFPTLDDRPVARFRFIADANIARNPLFAHVHDRRTNREPFDTDRAVPAETLIAVAAVARTARADHTAGETRVAELRGLAWEAMELELSTYRTAKESIDLLRIGKAEIEANPDGISIEGPLMEGLDRLGLMSRQDMLDTSTTVYRQQLAALRPGFDTAMAFLWLATSGNGRADQIAAGRDYVRVHLAATGAGLALQPMSQALQEYDEMADPFARMRRTLAIKGDETLQMFARLGYGPAVKAAPRWPLATRIRSA